MTPADRERTRRYLAYLDATYGTRAAQVEHDVAGYRALSPEQRARVLADVTRTAFLQRRWSGQSPPPDDPPAADFHDLWARLHARYLAGRSRGG